MAKDAGSPNSIENACSSMKTCYKIIKAIPVDTCESIDCTCGYQGPWHVFPVSKKRGIVKVTAKCKECDAEMPLEFSIVSHKRRILLAATALLGIFLFGFKRDEIRYGYELLMTQGPRIALNLLVSGNPDSIFQKAWFEYQAGDLDQATDTLDFMARNEIGRHLEARFYYLRGLIKEKRRLDPTEDYLTSLDRYRTEEGKSRVLTQLGYWHIQKRDFASAESFLSQVSLEDGFYFNTISEYFFYLGEFEKAMDAAEASRGLYEVEGNQLAKAGALSNIGYYSALLGNYETALEHSLEAQSLIVELGATRKYFYNLVNFVVMDCAPLYAKEIRKYANKTGDRALIELLDYSEKVGCNQHKDDGAPPPPPPG